MSKSIENHLHKYRRIGDLYLFKVKEYLPAILVTRMSSLLLITVDGLVVGNLTGSEALAAVSIFSPLSTLIGAFSRLVASGIGTSLSTTIGSNEGTEIKRIKGASFRLMIFFSIIAFFIQIPLVWFFLSAYRLTDTIYAMTWQYAFGIMIATPLGIISRSGAYMLQITGKMKIMARLTMLEGAINLVLDLLFVGPLHMGLMGAGLGTACASLIRCIATLIYLRRHTDMLDYWKFRNSFAECCGILRLGVPDAVSDLVFALQNYCMMKILLLGFGDSAGVINGVCMFCHSIVNVLIQGVRSSLHPLVGLLEGAGDREGLKILMRQGALIMAGAVVTATAVILLFPGIFYTAYGIRDIPWGGIASVRIFSLYLIMSAYTSFFLLFLVNKKDPRYTTRVTIAGNITQPLFALILREILPAPWIYLSLSMTAGLVLILYVHRFNHLYNMDLKEENPNDAVLYMSVRPQEAIEASHAIRDFAEERGINPRITFRIVLCMQEMVAYIESVNGKETAAQIIVRFKESGEATFVIMDNGKCIALQNEEEKEMGVSTDNYVIMQRLAKKVNYQYVQDLNYTILEFA